MTTAPTDLDWNIRLAVYRLFVEHARPPEAPEIARRFSISDDAARDAYRRLHAGHALFLEPDTTAIRLANPLSAIPTPYVVRVNGRDLYANRAWDSLGIPAMLRADAEVDARDARHGRPARYAVAGGELVAEPGLLTHFPLPFRRWHDDLIHT